MATVSKKENMTISIREYTDGQGQQKKVWKTIGELITWDDGKQSFEQWGPSGSTKGSIFPQDNQNNQPQQQTQQFNQNNTNNLAQQPQGGFGQPQQQNPNTPISNSGFGSNEPPF